ncbi:hypothetical protein [Treponema sp. OMZ 857]|uniref:hypothetical protein n=1 Tax=Treponema sp. OMZ 857 TaxID=1643513 RepID=UPI0020A470D8|nr:hypothetical protein [Treponema sp. OMZ 857]
MRDKSIIVYHGSDRIIAQPDTEHSRLNGISDMRCMSDDYLTEELKAEDIQNK